MSTYMHAYTHAYCYILIFLHTYVRAYILEFMHACMHAYIHTYKYHTNTIHIPYKYHTNTIPYHTIQADVEDGTGGIKYSCSLVKNIQVQAVLLAFSMRFTDIGLYMPARPWIRTFDHQNGKT